MAYIRLLISVLPVLSETGGGATGAGKLVKKGFIKGTQRDEGEEKAESVISKVTGCNISKQKKHQEKITRSQGSGKHKIRPLGSRRVNSTTVKLVYTILIQQVRN